MTEAAADELQPCSDCGRVHERDGIPTCTAHTRRDGQRVPCRNYPIQGGRVCRTHGGAAGNVRRAAAQRKVNEHMDRVLKLAVREVDPAHRDRTPDEQLLDEVARSSMIVEWLADQVAALNVPDPGAVGPLARLIGVDPETGDPILDDGSFNLWGPDHNGDAAPHIYWGMLNQERDRHARMCKLAIDAGISERLVRIAEAQGAAIVGVLLRVLEKLNLEADVLERARRYAAVELRKLSTTPASINA